ncbi:MAG: RNA methyltransferase [Magnetospiraceae bacterium]
MKGYFGIGVEGVSKARNTGALFRTAHAFGAGFVFTIGAAYEKGAGGRADTTRSEGQVPFYSFPDLPALVLPQGCDLVGVELLDDAVDLPSFRHPRRAAYVLGPEKGSLSPEISARCDHFIRIPTQFCVNLSVAGAIVMYDRLISLGRFAGRPVAPGGAPIPLEAHVQGGRIVRSALKQARTAPPEMDPDELPVDHPVDLPGNLNE